jgi:hypothetical protein
MPDTLLRTAAPAAQRSIHYRRRWAYALWVALLLLSAWALALWERPLALTSASLVVGLRVRNTPPGTQVKVWAGPWARWTGPDQFAASPIQVPLKPDGTATLPVFHIPIARRRWFKGYIPRDTWDLMMLEFTAPGLPSRYLPLPLTKDLRLGILRPKWKLTNTVSVSWSSLETEAKPPEAAP